MDDVSLHFCYDCAFKHVSSAKVLLREICQGYHNHDHISLFIGHLNCAADHIYEAHPDIAKAIRELRKYAWELVLDGDIHTDKGIAGMLDNAVQKLYDVVLSDTGEEIKLEMRLSDGKKEE